MKRLVALLASALILCTPSLGYCKQKVSTYELRFTKGIITALIEGSLMSCEGADEATAMVVINNKTGKVQVSGKPFLSKKGVVTLRSDDGIVLLLEHKNDQGHEQVHLFLKSDGTAYSLSTSSAIHRTRGVILTGSYCREGFWFVQ